MALQRLSLIEILELKFIGTIALLAFCSTTAIVIMEILARYIFNYSFMWAHEMAIYLVAIAAFLYFGITHRESGHLSVNVLPMVIKNRKIQKFCNNLASLISISYCFFCAVLTLKLVNMFYSNNVKSISTEFPVWVIYACLFLGFVLLIVSFCRELYRLSKKKIPKHISDESDSEP